MPFTTHQNPGISRSASPSRFMVNIFRPLILFMLDSDFSNSWCWLRTTNRFTCTGIGTTILFAELEEFWLRWLPQALDVALRPAFTLFHLARRFWNHIFTWNIKVALETETNVTDKKIEISRLLKKGQVTYSTKIRLNKSYEQSKDSISLQRQ